LQSGGLWTWTPFQEHGKLERLRNALDQGVATPEHAGFVAELGGRQETE
jgi:hypothetical protein